MGAFICELNNNMGDGSCLVDRISGLPDFILHQILSCLSTKKAAQTGLISKRWQSIWKTFPILNCNEYDFGRELDLLNPKELGLPKDKRRNIYNQREKFLSYIDEKLQRFHEENLCLKTFIVRMTLVSNNIASRVDTWMDLVSDMGVKELELFLTVGRGRFYVLPLKVLAVQSLTFLYLGGCLLSSSIDTDAIKLSSLIQLYLRDVSIDEKTIHSLISSIRTMEVLSLENCLGFDNLEISDHDKLKKIVYHSHRNLKVKKFIIKLSALEELDFCSGDKDKSACLIIVSSACHKLKRLSLSGIPVDTKWLQNMITSFPLLERLYLGGCVLQEVMKLSSSVLKEACVWQCENLVEAEFDTPNVQLFTYGGKNMPHIYSNNVNGKRVAEISVLLRKMDNPWFTKLNNFLRENKFQDLVLALTKTSVYQDMEIPFNAKDFVGNQFPPYTLNNMWFVTHFVTVGNYAVLLDGLLWSLRPQILSLELNYNSFEFVKGLLKSLVFEPESNCYCSQTLNCWRHSLKNIKLINVKGFETNTVLDAMTLSNLTAYLDNWETEARRIVMSYGEFKVETLSFHLSW